MKNIVSNTNTNFSYTSDLLFNSYYDFSYNNSDLFTIYQYNSPDLPIFEFYGSSYDSSDLFLDHDIYNKTQIENKRIDVLEDENIYRIHEENVVVRIASNDAAEILVLLSKMGESANVTLKGIDKENEKDEEDYGMEQKI
ncbi:hypothetical protein C1645_826654 [Glomus cerebriforme]|uniref:Uncharacterized protein n=1 Tax=Glomus cerebriforme TaxID=658196 RepID=A0A397SRA1_9GLOM|nr:hypothetical protein C1645_826654 [Glomus cerebriforme]